MIGNRMGWGKATFTLFLAAAALAGCGMQDLYEPPTAPYRVVGRLSLPSQVEGVDVLGSYAFVAGGQAGLVVVDISDPKDPELTLMLNTVKYSESVRVASTLHGGSVLDIAFVVEGTEGITTYDVTDPPNAFSFNQGTTAVDGDGLFIEMPDHPGDPYVVYLAESWKGLRIFESDPSIPGLLQYNGVFAGTRGYARSVAVKDGYAYVADDEMGVAVLDVRTRMLGAVRLVSSCDTDGEAECIALEGDYAFVADEENGLVVLEIVREGEDEIPTPHQVAHLALDGLCFDIVVRDGTAFLAADDGGVHVVDVTTPASPNWLGTIVTSKATGVAVGEDGVVVVSDRYDGILVLQGENPFTDRTAPSRVWDLRSTAAPRNAVRLEWTAPGDDGLEGNASSYDLRYSLDPIETEADWDSAHACPAPPAPGARGLAEQYWMDGLAAGTEYAFAMKTADEKGNWSGLSNSIVVVTSTENTPPTIRNASVRPEVAPPDSTFRFEITYEDWDNEAPTAARVVIDEEIHDLTAVSTDYRNGALFRYETSIEEWGEHEHLFVFSYGGGGSVRTDTLAGPGVGYVFTMGSPAGESGRDGDEALHSVALSASVEYADHEVSQAEYAAVMDTNPSVFVGDDLPVENVSWFDAVLYCNALSLLEGLTPAYTVAGETVTWDRNADGWRLPTEAEWERACRAGTATAFAAGGIVEEGCGFEPVLDGAGWYCGNAEATTHALKGKDPNDWDLYDMHGNVWEWCWDWYVEDLGSGFAVDPRGPDSGSQKVIRGGSWYDFARESRSASRAPYWPNSKDDTIGFRVVRTLFD
ncbi:MAG: SUMF1/EgtB/PvdO family nonheme iron enzyme [Candidatus Eisenbacteria bacterium]|nr:SUMF1/EgtB/PvdO family nonheme iron enzyme [Candidatus Eisenbacteria bacterium]